MRHMLGRRTWRTACITAAAALAAGAAALGTGGTGSVVAQEAQEAAPPDARKTLSETATERLLGSAPKTPVGTLRREVIETRTGQTLLGGRGDEGRGDDANPKVAPGLVRWHADLAAAQAASRVSGKPVLVFQLLGNLDDEFC